MIACLVARVHSTVRAASPRLTSDVIYVFFFVSVAQGVVGEMVNFEVALQARQAQH